MLLSKMFLRNILIQKPQIHLPLLPQVLPAAQRLLSPAQQLKAVQKKLLHQLQNKVDEKRISKYNKTGEN